MRGHTYSSSYSYLAEEDLHELADILAMQIHASLGASVFRLQRSDVIELIAPYCDDLHPEDQRALSWLIWQLFQEARDMHMHHD